MDKIEQKILDIIEQNAEKIIAFGDDIWHHAELGFMEHRTAQKFCDVLDELNLNYEKNLAVTGVKSYLKDKTEGEVRICLMGEMDALPIADHVDANPETGAAHCCGHDAQITGVMGAALALTDPEVMQALGGNVVFFGVPSEEGTTDYGDLSCVMPVIQFLTGGQSGIAHNASYRREDLYEYYVTPAKCLALAAYRLLKDEAALAKEIIADNKPMMTKEEYLAVMDSISKVETMEMVPVPKEFK